MAEYTKPLPNATEKFKEYWAGCKQRRLLIQRCKACGMYRWYPRYMCGNCSSLDTEWAEVRGRGKIYSYVTVYRSPLPAFRDDVPYTNVVVELDDIPYIRMLGRLIDCQPEEAKIGMPVEVVFDDATEEVTLPKWKPASS